MTSRHGGYDGKEDIMKVYRYYCQSRRCQGPFPGTGW